MTTEAKVAPYAIHGIEFLTNPALAGLPDELHGMGVLCASEKDGRKSTLLIDRDYALLILQARNLEGATVTERAIRWVRLGWPEEWATTINPTWMAVYPGTTP